MDKPRLQKLWEERGNAETPFGKLFNLRCFQGSFCSKPGARKSSVFPLALSLSFQSSIIFRASWGSSFPGTGTNPGVSSPLPKKIQPMLMTGNAFQHELHAGQTLMKPKAWCPSTVYQSHPFCLWFYLMFLGSHSLWNLKPSARLKLRWLEKDVSCMALSPHM